MQDSTVPASRHTGSSARGVAVVVSHEPLREGEIRLVDFGAGRGEPALINVRLATKPEYMAISYCWGSENCLHPFLVNDQALVLTSSLYDVFKELWDQGYRGKIWADAVCIKQDDDIEKSKQIPLMRDIYSNANEVFAWLGGSSLDDLAVTEIVGKLTEFDTHEQWGLETDCPFEDVIVRASLPDGTSRVWCDIADMLSSNWFTRLWTRQEAMTAQLLFVGFGHLILGWETVYLLVYAIQHLNFDPFWQTQSNSWHHNLSQTHLARVANIQGCRSRYRGEQLTPIFLFQQTRSKKTTEELDRVYALSGFMGPLFRRHVPVDMSLSPQQAFVRAAKALMKYEPGCMRLLAMAETGNRLPGLPSWVCDLTSTAPPWLLAGYCGYGAGFGGVIDPVPFVSMDDDESRLGMPGFRFDTVKETRISFNSTSLIVPSKAAASDFLEQIEECRSLVQRAQTSSVSESWVSLQRILVCDRPGWRADPTQKSFSADFSHLDTLLNQVRRYLDGSRPDFPGSNGYARNLLWFNIRRSLFSTVSGHLGMGPENLQPGDHILVLYGAETPFAARRLPDYLCFQLLGECYVDGIMEGQAVQAHRDAGKDEEVLVFA